MTKKEKTYKHIARGLARGPSTENKDGTVTLGPWQLVEIPFDLEKGSIGDVKLVEMEDLGYGIERLNVELEQELLKNGA